MSIHEKQFTRVISFYMTMLFLIGMTTLHAQTKLNNPHAPNTFLDSYLLPDSTIRFIGSEHGRDRELFFVDKLADGTITEPVFFPESIGELEFNFAGVGCKVLPLKSGDVILGINQADCDYAPYSSLARFNMEGEVMWSVSMEEYNINYPIQKLTQVDNNIICLISAEYDTLYFDLDGHEVIQNTAYIVYDTVIIAPIGYYATLGNNLFRLTEGFDVFNSTTVDDVIRTLSVSGDSLIIVSTASSLVVLEDDLSLAAHSDLYGNFDLLTTSSNWVWIGQKNADIIQLDYLLQPHESFSMPIDIQLRSMTVIKENLTLGGNYISTTGSSVFIHSSDVDQFSFGIKKDISLESVRIDQPVFYSFEPLAESWGFNIPYQNVVVTISNTGQDTIQALTILYGAGSGCLFCQGESRHWSFDSLNLYPGLQMDVALGDFSVWCVTQTPNKFCLSIFPADSLPETDQLNNRICMDVDAFLTGINEVEPSIWSISPNPADKFVIIHRDDATTIKYHGEILNGSGKLVERIELNENSTQIELVDFVPGIYFLYIMSAEGVYTLKKFSVIH